MIFSFGKSFDPSVAWASLVHWGCFVLKRQIVINCILKMAFQAIIYHLWRERNARIFTSDIKVPSVIVSAVLSDLTYRFLGLPKFKVACSGTPSGDALGF